MIVGVNRLTLCQECRREVFWARYCSSCTRRSLFPFGNKLIDYADDSSLMAALPSSGFRVTVAESPIRDLGKVSEWCNHWGIKLKASKTNIMIVSRSRTMHPQSTILLFAELRWRSLMSIGSDIWFQEDIWESVSRTASQWLGILRKSWRVIHDRSLLGRCFRDFVLPVLEHCSTVWSSAADKHL